MKYDPEKTYGVSYYDNGRDDTIQIHTDSLARAIIALITRSNRYPVNRIDLTTGDKLLGYYKDGDYYWQDILNDADWQKYIQNKLKT